MEFDVEFLAYMCSSVLSFVLLTISVLSFLAILGVLYYNYRAKKLKKRVFRRRYGTLLEDLNLNTKIGVFWTSLVQARWIVTHLIMVFLRENPELQILSLLVVN
jgi:hypothetical protein